MKKKYVYLHWTARVILMTAAVITLTTIIMTFAHAEIYGFWKSIGNLLSAFLIGAGGCCVCGKVDDMAEEAWAKWMEEKRESRRLRVDKEGA